MVDEVDDFLDADKLVFNICSNKGNSFPKATLDAYLEVGRIRTLLRQIRKIVLSTMWTTFRSAK